MSDDSTTSFHLSKKTGLPIALLKGELDQLRLATNELVVTSKDEGQTNLTVTSVGVESSVPISYATGVSAITDQQLTNRGLVNSLILAAKNSVS